MPYLGLPGEMAQRLMSDDPAGTTKSDIKTVSSRLALLGGTAAVATTGIPFYLGTRALGAGMKRTPMITQPVKLIFHYESQKSLINYIQYGMYLYDSWNTQRLGAPLAASPNRTTPPQSGGKREAPSKKGSQRASGDAKHRRAHKCPKGHYWSYKHKKCVKSKF